MAPLRLNEIVASRRRWLGVAGVACILALVVAAHHVELDHGTVVETMVCVAVIGAVGGAVALAAGIIRQPRLAVPTEVVPTEVGSTPVRRTDRPRDGPARLQVFLT